MKIQLLKKVIDHKLERGGCFGMDWRIIDCSEIRYAAEWRGHIGIGESVAEAIENCLRSIPEVKLVTSTLK